VSDAGLAPEPMIFPLRSGRGSISLHASGFRHPGGAFAREAFTAYADLTHWISGSRALRFGTRQGLFVIPRNWFPDPDQADAFQRALFEHVARETNGAVHLARMADVDAFAREGSSRWASRGIALACLAVYALELWLGPAVHHAGFFSSLLAVRGEPWRLLTANLLHADLVHLSVNTIGLLVLGGLVERSLGTGRTIWIAGLSALGATLAGVVAGYEALVGASGIVAGFAAAILLLEFRFPERLPVQWRIPRRLFVMALLADAMLPLAVPFVAGAAHFGGFLAGGAATAIVAAPGLRREPVAPALRVAIALVAAVAVASLLSASRLLGGGRAWESHAERLLDLEETSPLILNDAAWLIATGRAPTRKALVDARELARRAVDATDRLDPNLLDTLAEVEFQSGHADEAVDVIDEAIRLAPEEPYFREQKRRFAGERAADDRPAPPEPFFDPAPEPRRMPDDRFHRFGPEADPGIEI
jgi:membrane associated rhomboid family serine protease